MQVLAGEQHVADQLVAPVEANGGVVAAENALKRPAEDAAEQGPDAKRLHTETEQQQPVGING